MEHNGLFNCITGFMLLVCACATETDLKSHDVDTLDIDRRSAGLPALALPQDTAVQRRDDVPLLLNTAKLERAVRRTLESLELRVGFESIPRPSKRSVTELAKRAIDVSGLKIPLIGDYFKFLNIPTFGEYYNMFNLPYISLLNIGQEPETAIDLDIGPLNCKCKGRECYCCMAAITVCAKLQSLTNTIGANIELNAFGFPLFNAPIPLINKPVCFTLFDIFGKPVKVCFEFYNTNTLVVKNSACVTVGLEYGPHRLININIGCIGIGFDKLFSYKLPPNLDFFDIPALGFKTH